MRNSLEWTAEALEHTLVDAGHTPEDPVWSTAMELLPYWTGTVHSLHECAHARSGAPVCRIAPSRLAGSAG